MKKILMLLTTSVALSASLVSLNSCGNKPAVEKIRSTEFPFELDWNDPAWEISDGSDTTTHHYSYIDLEMKTDCVDGDTFEVHQPATYFDHPSITQKHLVTFEDGTLASETKFPNIRTAGIDTPELHYKKDNLIIETDGEEKVWAQYAKEFCEEELIKNNPTKRIRVVPEEGTYNRWAAYVFYGINFQKSYSVEIIKKGLALPFIDYGISKVFSLMNKKYQVFRYIGLPIINAWRNSVVNKVGLGGIVNRLSDVLNQHGPTNLPSKEDADQLNEIFNSFK